MFVDGHCGGLDCCGLCSKVLVLWVLFRWSAIRVQMPKKGACVVGRMSVVQRASVRFLMRPARLAKRQRIVGRVCATKTVFVWHVQTQRIVHRACVSKASVKPVSTRKIVVICAVMRGFANLAMPTNNVRQAVVSRAVVSLAQSEKSAPRDFVMWVSASPAIATVNVPGTARKPAALAFHATKITNAPDIATRRTDFASLVKSAKTVHKHCIARSQKAVARLVSETAIVPVYALRQGAAFLVQKPTIVWKPFFAAQAASVPSATAEPIVVQVFAKKEFVKKAASTMHNAHLVCARWGVVRSANKPKIALRIAAQMAAVWGLAHATISA